MAEPIIRARTPQVRRVALYSHDTQGLGHIRRNIVIAAALVAADPATNVLLLTGARRRLRSRSRRGPRCSRCPRWPRT